jgi:predicted NUDIX family phosphoesterase
LSKDDEVVMCISREKLHELFGDFTGYRALVDRNELYHKLLADEHIVWLRRGDCENDPNYKQIIPYVVITHYCADQTVFRYQRVKSGQAGEERLLGMSSIGLGGHINPTDGSGEDGPCAGVCFDAAVGRELQEEVRMDTGIGWQPVGLINHDENDVGQVHVGVAVMAHVEVPAVYPAEPGIYAGHFSPLRDLKRRMDANRSNTGFERWTEILLDSEFFGPVESWTRGDVIVAVRGGVVQSVYGRDASLEVAILDWDDLEALPAQADERVEMEQLDDIATEHFTTIF